MVTPQDVIVKYSELLHGGYHMDDYRVALDDETWDAMDQFGESVIKFLDENIGGSRDIRPTLIKALIAVGKDAREGLIPIDIFEEQKLMLIGSRMKDRIREQM